MTDRLLLTSLADRLEQLGETDGAEDVRAARDEIERLQAALETGASWFDEYARGHREKGATEKAQRNELRADFLRRAIPEERRTAKPISK